jgi:sugar lactone lactonase YvrE
VALDAQGYLYVVDQNNHRVLKFDADGGFITMWGRNGGDGTAGSGNGEFNAPTGIAVDPAGRVYVADYYNHRIQKFAADGAFLAKWGRNGGDGSAGSGAGEFTQPMGVAVDAFGSVYVGEFSNGRIQKFDRYGRLLHTWASGNGHGVAVDGAGRVYTLTYTESLVRQYTWSSGAGTYQQTASWPVAGNPGGFCVDGAGTIYVAETWAFRVRRFAPDGTELTQWGSGGSGNGQFSIPCGVVVSHDGRVYVSDTGNNRIQRFRRTDAPPRTVTFQATAGGSLTGTALQSVDSGTGTTPVTAVPDPHYHFVRWTLGDDPFSLENPLALASVTADLTLTAEFAIDQYTLTYAPGPHGGIEGASPQTVDYGTAGSAVEAVPAPGYHFVQWSDSVTDNPRTDTNVTDNLSVTAEFAIDQHTLTYAAGAHGSIVGAAQQTVAEGASGTAVTAAPDFGFAFTRWSDLSPLNPRQDVNVTASVDVTAEFAASTAVEAGGNSLAVLDAGAVAMGRGLWDLSGTYTTEVAGSPLVIHLVHGSRGELTGTATLTVGTAVARMPVKGVVRGVGGGLTARFGIKGVSTDRVLRAALTFNLTLHAAARQLAGQLTGSVQAPGLAGPVGSPVTLDLPALMDGTWSLRFDVAPGTNRADGSARLTLSNGVAFDYALRARLSGQRLVGDLSAAQAAGLAKGIRIRATITQWSGGWARLETLSGTGYGQCLGW